MSYTNYVYGLRDPRDGKIKYVGQTRNPEARYSGHVAIPTGRGLNAKEQWIKELRDVGAKPELVILERPAIGEATNRAERKWIREAQADSPVFNVQAIGGFVPPRPRSPRKPSVHLMKPLFPARRTRHVVAPPIHPESRTIIESYLG